MKKLLLILAFALGFTAFGMGASPDAQARPYGWHRGHGHHYGWKHGPRRHYGWYRGHHRGWNKHPRHHRHWR